MASRVRHIVLVAVGFFGRTQSAEKELVAFEFTARLPPERSRVDSSRILGERQLRASDTERDV